MKSKRRLLTKRIAKMLITSSLFVFALSITAFAGTTDNGIPDDYVPAVYNGIAAQQFKNVFELPYNTDAAESGTDFIISDVLYF